MVLLPFLLHSLHSVTSNEATLSGLEPVSTVLLGSGSSASISNKPDDQSMVKPKSGLVLGGGLPSIPADLLEKVLKGSYVELAAF